MNKLPVYLSEDYAQNILLEFKKLAILAVAEAKKGAEAYPKYVDQKTFMKMFQIGHSTMQDLYSKGLDYSTLGKRKMICLEDFYELLENSKF